MNIETALFLIFFILATIGITVWWWNKIGFRGYGDFFRSLRDKRE